MRTFVLQQFVPNWKKQMQQNSGSIYFCKKKEKDFGKTLKRKM